MLLGVTLPSHLSPFVEEKDGDYIPPERGAQLATESVGKEDDDMLEDGEQEMSKEEKKLAASMLPKKRRQLYERIVRAQKKKASEVRV